MCRLFADDSSLQSTCNNLQTLENNLNHDLQQLEVWSQKWLLQFNPQKTKAVFFTNSPNITTPNLIFRQCPLEFVMHHKHLGVIFSQNLSWSYCFDSILSKVKTKWGLMKKLKFKLSRKTLSLMYTTFVRPILEYASEVWGGCNQTDAEKLEKL